MSPLTRIGRALAGLVGGTVLGFALLVLGYVAYVEISGDRNGDFGLGFGLVIAPLGGLLLGIAMAGFLAISRRVKSATLFLLVSLLAAIAAYVIATLI